MRVLCCGLLLGVASRFEEVTEGFSVGISSDSAWVAVAFLAGSARSGVVAMTAANVGYYLCVAASGMPLDAAAGPVEGWLMIGLLAGVVLGFLGGLWRGGASWAPLAVAAVFVSEGIEGPWTDRIGLVLGLVIAWLAAGRVATSGGSPGY